MSERTPVRRALLGVYDKSGVEELARGLADAGVELVSTGATAARIADAGIPVTPVEQVTGFPECLDGRVKTLHPAVHAGIDTGPVLVQRPVPVHPGDDETRLHERIKTVERELLVQTVADLAAGSEPAQRPAARARTAPHRTEETSR